jgi:hypothetical protein
MIRVTLKEPDDPAWKNWRKRCEEETELLKESVRKGKRRKIKSSLYKGMKTVLFDLYNNKCAYCEAPFIRYPGDLDHFRPKNRVTDKKGELVHVIDDRGNSIPHPGYYWLAYDWRNLLPSCNHCNRPNTGASGIVQGKWDQFPVEGARAWKPDEETQESALLLNPVSSNGDHNPETELIFDPNGIVGGTTVAANKTIELLGLNDDPLIDERREAYKRATRDARDFFEAILRRENDPECRAECAAILQGKAYFSAVAKLAINECKEAVLGGFAILDASQN